MAARALGPFAFGGSNWICCCRLERSLFSWRTFELAERKLTASSPVITTAVPVATPIAIVCALSGA